MKRLDEEATMKDEGFGAKYQTCQHSPLLKGRPLGMAKLGCLFMQTAVPPEERGSKWK